ncbi:hypothetical protein CWB41_04175 [Methylovirgula ligni]|uniref:hypothetical protein n=1 Tax=Methylovirgula ligni TaxID=569860 RepID=UPI0010C4359B|nr:hypothetical protein [Methylovirgula ligni]QAY95026.1 hypothetical protein CWB41_04175 [Methylovirgula ligni]
MQRLLSRRMPLALFGVNFIVASISGMIMADIVIVVAFQMMQAFIAPVVVVMHADRNTVWAQDHRIRHGTRREKESDKGY